MAGLHRLEGRPHRHLGLAKSDIATKQSVHRLGPLHVGTDCLDRGELVGGFIEGE